jgi:translation initiation factor IF-3
LNPDGTQAGIVSIEEGLKLAYAAGLDLVEISPTASPPVCRVMDYGKYLYEQRKKKADAKKNQKQVNIKEVKFRPTTEEGDYQVKLKKLTNFLVNGDKTKVTLRFKGREAAHPDLGMQLLMRVQEDLEEYSVVESYPKKEGKMQMIMVLAPKRK